MNILPQDLKPISRNHQNINNQNQNIPKMLHFCNINKKNPDPNRQKTTPFCSIKTKNPYPNPC